ncbi:MAG: MBL fold metallo-hydrolase [Candidatus Sericytochromatia bacterium]
MIFRQFFDYETYTYTYIIADEKTKEAAIIDSVDINAERDAQYAKELGLDVKYLMETHVHADHITGVSELKKYFPNAKSVVSKFGGTECTDIYTDDGDVFNLGEMKIKVLSTPGHTNGCVSFYTDGMVFTGDSLFARGTGRTDFQNGDAGKLYDGIVQKLFVLPDDTVVYPGHDYKGALYSTIGEEKQFNPRLAGKTRDEFIEIMNNLKLPHPKKISESVPANLKCGNKDLVSV